MKLKSVILVLFLFSCKSLTRDVSSIVKLSCKDFNLHVKENWQFISEGTYYKTNYKFVRELDSTYHDCIIGLSIEQIIKIFGDPTSGKKSILFQSSNALKYLISPPPSPPKYSSANLYFILDANFKVSKTIVLGTQVSIDE